MYAGLAPLPTMVVASTQSNCLAAMVVRSYSDRVRDALLGTSEEWQWDLTTAPRKRPRSPSHAGTCRAISSLNVRGPRQSRRGHVLLLIENASTRLEDLSSMARSNIAWGVSLSQKHEADDGNLDLLGKEIFSTLSSEGFKDEESVLRVDTFPKELSAAVCQSLQQAAGSTDSSNPYEGPVKMTKSASKCTHVVTVIRTDEPNVFAWGVSDKATHVSVKLNNEASDEVMIQSTDSLTGLDLSPNNCLPVDAPVSRAYYKLHQVWDDILCHEFPGRPPTGIGLDLGSSPGGWTQVLKQYFGLSQVITVDPGVMSHRVMSLPGVCHVATDMASCQVAQAIHSATAAKGERLSFIVCDASRDPPQLLDKMTVLMENLGPKLLTLPAALVITLKFPSATPSCIERNMEIARKVIPTKLRKIASLAYDEDVKSRYKIVHLMANSDSERTLVVVFES